jgi:carbamoyl-phosphate synthase small subunit
LKNAYLLLSNNECLKGVSIGYSGSTFGELVFNTSITGYQEIISDPSYKNQIITFTYPHIGNVGFNINDYEANGTYVSGVVVNQLPTNPSNWRSESSFSDFLIKNKIICIANIDTRYLTSMLRDKGSLNACISTEVKKINSLQDKLKKYNGIVGVDLAKEVSTKKSYFFNEKNYYVDNKKIKSKQKYSVVAYDFGIKKNILRILKDLGCKTKVIPANTKAKDVLNMNPDGIFLSNGPGDPAACKYAIDSIKEFYKHNIPLFGICLGHQLMGIASGAETIKMPHGHHGANHPVIDLKTKRVFITSQNHGFVINEKSIPSSIEVTHKSLFDDTIQGIKFKKKPFFSFQGHPEASPGPQDMAYIFLNFINNMKKYKCQKEKI